MLHSSVPFRPYFSLLHAALSLLSFLSQKPAPPSFYFSSNSFLSVCAVCFALMAHDRQEACLSTQLASQATSHTRSLVSNTMGGDFRNGVSQKKKKHSHYIRADTAILLSKGASSENDYLSRTTATTSRHQPNFIHYQVPPSKRIQTSKVIRFASNFESC